MKFFTHYTHTGFCNTYLIGPDEQGDAILIDPGVFDASLLSMIEENGLYLRHILLTHAHDGHINALKTIVKIYETRIYYFGHSVLDMPTTRVREGEDLELGDFTIGVLEAPGHSGDSIVYKLDGFLFTGDTLQAGKIGNTQDDFSKDLLLSSIKEKILNLDDELFIFPGHGPPSKVGIERLLNPNFQEDV